MGTCVPPNFGISLRPIALAFLKKIRFNVIILNFSDCYLLFSLSSRQH